MKKTTTEGRPKQFERLFGGALEKLVVVFWETSETMAIIANLPCYVSRDVNFNRCNVSKILMINIHCISGSSAVVAAAFSALSSTVLMMASAEAATLKVELEVLGQIGNGAVTPLWFGFHDGRFNTFDPGTPASSGIELIAEDGISGLEDPAILNALGIDPNLGISTLFSDTVPNGVQNLVAFTPILGTLPGQSASTIVRVDPSQNRFFSYASMFFPSNDAFIADLDPLELFDATGKFIKADWVIFGTEVYDAGTEVNDENLDNIPFSASMVGRGVPEGGTIQLHPGLLPAGQGGVLDNSIFNFSTADFTAPGYRVARIRVSQVPESHSVLGLVAALGLGALLHKRALKK